MQLQCINNESVSSSARSRFYNQHSICSRVFSELSPYTRCSDNKTACLNLPRASAISKPYIRANRQNQVSWLIFDIDVIDQSESKDLADGHRQQIEFPWERANLPEPNLTVINRSDQRMHIWYAIETVCVSQNGSKKAIRYMKAVYDAMSLALNSDSNYHATSAITKTPHHPNFRTLEIHTHEYSLGELADYVALQDNRQFPSKLPNLDEVKHSRHCTLFERLRFFAYQNVQQYRQSGSLRTFTRLLERQAKEFNVFFEPLTEASLRSTVKSIANWTWRFYSGHHDGKNRGVMDLDPSLELSRRQAKGAQRTNAERVRKAKSAVAFALKQLSSSNKRITATAVAKLAKCARQTASKYMSIIEQEIQAKSKHKKSVNYSAYQVRALQRSFASSCFEVSDIVACVSVNDTS